MPATRTSRGDTTHCDPAPTRPAWAHYLIDLRSRRGLAAKEVAARLGISASTYAGMEAGTRTRNGVRTEATLKDDTVHRIIDALHLTPAEARHLITLITTSVGNRSPWQARLRLARISAGVSAAQAAQAAGVAEDTYREWERKGTGSPRHHLLRKVLAHLGWDDTEVAEFMATVPPDAPVARAPRQPSNPVTDLPAWSQHITQARLDAGLYLTQADARIGQASVIRRFELGGWPRVDSRLSVPTCGWLDRIAAALDMDAAAAQQLHRLADEQRVLLAHQGAALHGRPVLSELLYEARSTTDCGPRTANRLYGLPDYTWYRAEAGDQQALDVFTANLIDTIIATWGLGEPLAEALRMAVTNPPQPADSPH
jgi:transcriptional regulator with XRE-family HTH domain